MKPRVIGKGLVEKRTRLVRLLEKHIAYLAVAEALQPWTPRAFGHEPRPRQTPEEWAARWERYAPPRYVWPRERPELAHPCPGPEDVPEETVKAWIAREPFIRGGLAFKTAQACAYIESFRRRDT